MSIETEISSRLKNSVADTTVPPGLARVAVVGGRRRRRRRTAAGVALVTATIAAGAVLVPLVNAPDTQLNVAAGPQNRNQLATAWAASLPEGDHVNLPYFAQGRLWSAGSSVRLPASINASVGPWAVEGGWVVLVGHAEANMVWAVLSPDGGLRNLPAETYDNGLGMARMHVSPDGRQLATDRWLVDLDTMTATELPHAHLPIRILAEPR